MTANPTFKAADDQIYSFAINTDPATATKQQATTDKLEALRILLSGPLAVTGPLTAAQIGALGLGTDAKLEAIRALLASPLAVSGPLTSAQLVAAGLATHADAQAIATALSPLATDGKLEAVRALLAAPLAITAGALPLPTGAASETRLEAVRALLAGTLNVLSAPGEAHVGQVGGHSAIVGATLTRPGTVQNYVAGQLMANSGVAGSVVPVAIACARKAAGTGAINRVRLSSTAATAAGAIIRVHAFKTAPTSTVGDGGVFAGAINGVTAIHLGHFDVSMDRQFSDGVKGVGAPAVGGQVLFDTPGGTQNLYFLLEARSSYASPAGEVLTIAAEVLQD